jgi:hypothetical protein
MENSNLGKASSVSLVLHCPKKAELKFKLVKYFLMQLNIQLYGTLTLLLLSIQLNFKPYICENASLVYIILHSSLFTNEECRPGV